MGGLVLDRKRLALMALVAVFALVAAACDSGGTTDATEEEAATEEGAATEEAATEEAATEEAATEEAATEEAATEEAATEEAATEAAAVDVPDNEDVGVTSDTIRIGWLGDITGPTASAQTFNLLGSEAAVAYYNEQGGVAGRQLELIPLDDAFVAETATTNYASLTQDEGVLALVHVGGSDVIAALLPQSGDRRRPADLPAADDRGAAGGPQRLQQLRALR